MKMRESNHDDGDRDYTLQKCNSLNKSNTEENSTSILLLATVFGWTLFCLQNLSASILPGENKHQRMGTVVIKHWTWSTRILI